MLGRQDGAGKRVVHTGKPKFDLPQRRAHTCSPALRAGISNPYEPFSNAPNGLASFFFPEPRRRCRLDGSRPSNDPKVTIIAAASFTTVAAGFLIIPPIAPSMHGPCSLRCFCAMRQFPY